MWEDPLYADSAAVDRLIAFIEKPDKTAFATFVAGEYAYQRAELDEVKGLNALYAGDVEAAARLLAAAGDAPLPADPFELHTRDNHDRDAARPGHVEYSKAAAARRLAALLRTAEAGGPDAPAAR